MGCTVGHAPAEMMPVTGESVTDWRQGDWVGALRQALPEVWDVVQSVDPFGDVSVVVFPVDDRGAVPTFVLAERDGLLEVATIRDDVPESEQLFDELAQAVDAVVSAVAARSA